MKNLEIHWRMKEKTELVLISWCNKNKSMKLNIFKHPFSRPWCGFKFIVDLFAHDWRCHWVEITILDWLVSFRIDTKFGKRRLEIWQKKESAA